MKHTYIVARSKQPLTSGHTCPALLFRFLEYQHLLRFFHDHSVPQQKHSTRWLHSNIYKNMTHRNNWVSFHLIIWTTWVSLSVSPLLDESLNHRHITMSESILPRVLLQHQLTWSDDTLSPLSSTVLISFNCCDKKKSVRENKKLLFLFMISEAHDSWPVIKQGSMIERMEQQAKPVRLRRGWGEERQILWRAWREPVTSSWAFLRFPSLSNTAIKWWLINVVTQALPKPHLWILYTSI